MLNTYRIVTKQAKIKTEGRFALVPFLVSSAPLFSVIESRRGDDTLAFTCADLSRRLTPTIICAHYVSNT